MSKRAAVVIAATPFVLAFAAAADVEYWSQTRTVACTASVPLNGQSESRTAPDFELFEETVNCSRSGPGSAQSTAFLSCDLLADRIIASGHASGSWTYGGGSFGGYSVQGGGLVDVSFQLDRETAYTLDMSYTLSDGPPPAPATRFLLEGPKGFGRIMSDAASADLETSGVMPAGVYRLLMNVSRSALGNNDAIATAMSLELVFDVGCAADFDNDGTVNSQDFFTYLAAFFAENPSADVNSDGVVNSQDLFDFLAVFFAGC